MTSRTRTADGRAGETPEERTAKGRAAREKAPRSAHGEFAPAPARPSPLETLGAQDETRVPELVPVRYGRMLASPFAFYRGGAAVMAADLAQQRRTGLDVQLCGDAHLSNFGVFRAPDRRLVFDVNDFDETHPGPFEWDLKRLVASFEIAGRELGLTRKQRGAAIRSAVDQYREAMTGFAGMRDLDVWYSRVHVEELLEPLRATVTPARRKAFDKNLRKAKNKDSLRALDRLTVSRNGDVRIASRPPLLVPLNELVGDAEDATSIVADVMTRYRKSLEPATRHLISGYEYVDAAHKVVGVGSVGNRAWICLLRGRDAKDPLFLQLKEAGPSVLEPFTSRSRYSQHGRRVVEGQRLTQAASDQLLGWLSGPGVDGVKRDFYVRQLWDGKGSAEVEMMGPRELKIYGRLCGWTLARAHARTGDRIAIASYLGRGRTFGRAMTDFAESYADQNQSDYDEVRSAADAGRLEVKAGL
ncbi:MAG: hypothetical protein K0S15_2024 [Solirubrobacterales bacterium]|nr:hypothetical protein [Solirubrobacterales bacterium]